VHVPEQPTTPASTTSPTSPPRPSLLRTIALRALLYTLLCAVVLFSLIDPRSLWPSNSTAPPTPLETSASGPGWPHLRGPTYDAHAPDFSPAHTHLADSWPPSGPPVLWNREIGAGYSGLITHAGRAYTQTQSLTKQKLLALDADTGRTLWEHDYAWPYQPGGMFPGPRATPTFANGRIYFAAPDGLVACLDATDGRPVWSLNVLKQFDGRGADFGYACSPVVEAGLVILPVGGPSASVVALDADTGATRWTSGSAPASYASALPITFQGRRQLVTFLQNALAGFDLTTGRPLWE
jgi:glucose dehydrogenase